MGISLKNEISTSTFLDSQSAISREHGFKRGSCNTQAGQLLVGWWVGVAKGGQRENNRGGLQPGRTGEARTGVSQGGLRETPRKGRPLARPPPPSGAPPTRAGSPGEGRGSTGLLAGGALPRRETFPCPRGKGPGGDGSRGPGPPGGAVVGKAGRGSLPHLRCPRGRGPLVLALRLLHLGRHPPAGQPAGPDAAETGLRLRPFNGRPPAPPTR